MRKFKLISTFAALILMVALMAFGVYAVSTVSISVSGTITFKCTDVYIKVTYGMVGGTTYGPYFSQPGEAISWKDEAGKAVTFDSVNNTFANKLPDMKFTETNDDDEETKPTCTYFITVKNLHGMPIGLKLGYKFANIQNTQNKINVVNKVVDGTDINATAKYQINDAADGIVYTPGQFVENSTLTLFVTLTLSNEDKVAGGSLQMALSSAVNVSGVPAITF